MKKTRLRFLARALTLMSIGMLPALTQAAPLPPAIKCQAKLPGVSDSFEIRGLDAGSPSTTLSHAQLQEFDQQALVTRVSFSDEHDHGYAFLFFTEDLQAVAQGESRRAKGLVSTRRGHAQNVVCERK